MIRWRNLFARIMITQLRDEPASAGLRLSEWRVTGFLCHL